MLENEGELLPPVDPPDDPPDEPPEDDPPHAARPKQTIIAIETFAYIVHPTHNSLVTKVNSLPVNNNLPPALCQNLMRL